jgi:CO/xanthine dehydrogenase Mo-binding subunit
VTEALLGHQREPFGEREVYWVTSLGVKGLGELKNVGVYAAVANAVFHATG